MPTKPYASYRRRGGRLRVARAVDANRVYTKYGGYQAVRGAQTLQATIRRAIAKNNNKMLETKQANYTRTDGLEIYHNNFINLDTNMLLTTQGVEDPTTSSSNNRIGDKINLKGINIKMMVELNERYSDVTFRFIVIKKAKGDTLDRTTLFNGLSGNKMLDTINTERFTILFQKYFKIKAPNNSALGALGAGGVGSGINNSGTGTEQIPLSRASRIIKCWIPGNKFTKSGIITYENATSQPKFFDYTCVLYAYSNFSTLQDVYYVGRLNDYVATMYFKDA